MEPHKAEPSNEPREPVMRLLADKESSGIDVQLYWDEAADPDRDAVVTYRDRLEGVAYQLRLPRARALDAFYHPNSYLDAAEVFYVDHALVA